MSILPHTDRRTVLKTLGVGTGAAFSLSAATDPTDAQTASVDDWPMFQFDEANTGHSPTTGPKQGVQEKWAFETGDDIRSSSPAVVNGDVYVGSWDGRVYAIDAATGSKQWSTKIGDQVYSSPAVVDNTVLVSPLGLESSNTLITLNSNDGNIKWAFKGEGHGSKQAPVPANDIVFVPETFGSLYAVNIADGTQRWVFRVYEGTFSSPAVMNGLIFTGNNITNKLYAINATDGTEVWSFETNDRVKSPPAVADGVVYFGSHDQNVYAVDVSTGEELWSFETNAEVVASPAIADGTVYIGSRDTNLYALDAENGEELWRFDTGIRFVSGSVAVANGVVYVGAEKVYGLDATNGSKLWEFADFGGWISESSPAVIDGITYIGANDNYLYALEEGTIEVEIDIKPCSDPNAIEPDTEGVIPVGIKHTGEFDPVGRVDVSTLRFGASDLVENGGGAATIHGGHVEDVVPCEGDGKDDLVVHFPTENTGFDGDEDTGRLEGETTDGTPLFGEDSVKLVGEGDL